MKNIRYDIVDSCDRCRWVRAFASDEDFQIWLVDDNFSVEDSLNCALVPDSKINDKLVIPEWCPLIKPQCDKCGTDIIKPEME